MNLPTSGLTFVTIRLLSYDELLSIFPTGASVAEHSRVTLSRGALCSDKGRGNMFTLVLRSSLEMPGSGSTQLAYSLMVYDMSPLMKFIS